MLQAASVLGLILLLQAPDAGAAAILTPAQRAQGEASVTSAGKALADTLKDPDSARFRNVFIQKRIGDDKVEHIALCGEVNGKNGYGAMTGWHRFMLLGDRVLVGDSSQTINMLNADYLCLNNNPINDTVDYTDALRAAFNANAGR